MKREMAERSREKARQQGSFNEMDGRYHKEKTREAVLIKDHISRTFNRRMCHFHQRGWCKNGYGCTLSHFNYQEKTKYLEEGDLDDIEDAETIKHVSKDKKRNSDLLKKRIVLKTNANRWAHKPRGPDNEEDKDEDWRTTETFIYRHFRTPGHRSSTARSSRG